MTASKTPWKAWQKISFRFFFPFLALTSYLCWDVMIYITHATFYRKPFDLGNLYRPLAAAFYWLDKHIYHTGFNPGTQQSFPGDNHFGVTFYLTIFFFSIIVAIVWSILDRRRADYSKLYYWLCLYLRYALAIVMFSYGMDKLIPVQMLHPDVLAMTTPYGELNRYFVLWNFMGVSPGYMMFTGICEVVAALLLFSRRTAVPGYVLMAGILANVVAINVFYNVTVKLFSSQLLLYTLFLLAPYLKNILQFFFTGGTALFSQRRFIFKSKRKNNLITGLLIAIPFALGLINTIGTYKRYLWKTADAEREKIYIVTAFVATDSLPPHMDDSLRWKRILFNVFANHAIIFTRDDKLDGYECDTDKVKKTFTLHDNPDKKTWKTFSYADPSKDRLQLNGKWKSRDVQVSLQLLPADSIRLNKEKIKWIGD